MKKNKWLLVANGSLARLFKVEKKDHLVEIKVFKHPESRLHTRDLVSDKPGRDFESANTARHAIEPPSNPKDLEFELFAKELSHYLEEARVKGEFDSLYLAASPSLLGLLRQRLNPSTAKLIQGEANKDMTHLTAQEMVGHLPFLL
jgi:protein required for attachment to host cells